MSTKKIVSFITIGIIIVEIIFGITIWKTLTDYKQALAKTTIANTIAQFVFQRRLLADEYLFSQSARVKIQWELIQSSLYKKINETEASFTDQEEKDSIRTMKEGIEESEDVFLKLVGLLSAKQSDSSPQILDEQKVRLASQLSVKAQQTISAASTLANRNNQNITHSLQQLIFLFLTSSLLFFSLLVISFWIIWKSVRQLDEQKAKNDAILSGIGDGVVVINTDFTIRLWNKAAEKITGYSAAEALGKPLQKIFTIIRGYDRTPHYNFVQDTLLQKQVSRMEEGLLLIRKDKEEIPTGDSAAPIFDLAGKVTGVVIIFRDTTQEIEARKLKSDYAYQSHQLRTPITKTLWYLELLQKGTNPEQSAKFISKAYQAHRSTMKLVEQILDVTEIDQARLMPKLRDVSLEQLFNEPFHKLRPDAEERNVHLSVMENIPSITFQTDPKLLKRVIFEVLDNAIIYNKPDGLVEISFTSLNNEIVIKIVDSGIGIIVDEQPQIFTKFFRGGNYNTTEISGAGLGLFISKEYIKILKGKIWFESKENTGTTFYIALPM